MKTGSAEDGATTNFTTFGRDKERILEEENYCLWLYDTNDSRVIDQPYDVYLLWTWFSELKKDLQRVDIIPKDGSRSVILSEETYNSPDIPGIFQAEN